MESPAQGTPGDWHAVCDTDLSMDYGMHLSASGALTAMYRMDVLTNNLANMNTVGYKGDIPVPKQRLAARLEDKLEISPNEMLERLGGGVHQGRTRTDFTQGTLTSTDSELDVAIQGSGFLVLREGQNGNSDRLKLTRNGRMIIDKQGRLVSADTGLQMMSVTGDAIIVNPRRPLTINTDGAVVQSGKIVGRLRLVDVPNVQALSKAGHSMFSAPPEALSSRIEGGGIIRQGFIEQAAIDPLRTTMAISTAAREIETNLSMLQYSDKMLERAVNTLGRVA